MKVYDATGRPVALGRELARGGEGLIYTIDGQPGSVAKIYTPAPREGHEDKLRWMVAHPPQDPGRAAGTNPAATGSPHQAIAWPNELLYDVQRRFLGFVMPFVRDTVPILVVFNPRSRMQTLPGFDRRYLHRTARNLAAAFAALHESSYIAGDLNESNVLVTASALVTLIDTDSFQVQEPQNGRIIVYPCPVGKAEYTAPELQGRTLGEVLRQSQHDVFALAVLIFQLLMEGSHPFRARWLGSGDPPPLEERIRRGFFPHDAESNAVVAPPPGIPSLDTLHPELAELMRRCFRNGHSQPNSRPTACDWEQALAEAEQALVDCTNGHVFAKHLDACPICGSPASRVRTIRRPRLVTGPGTTGQTQGGLRTRPAASQRARVPTGSMTQPSSFGMRGGTWNIEDWLMRMARQVLLPPGAGAAPTAMPSPAAQLATTSQSVWHLFIRALDFLMRQPAGTGKTGSATPVAIGTASFLSITCPRCGVISSGDEIYCQGCGTQLATDRKCPRCSRNIPRNSHYCPNCATRLP